MCWWQCHLDALNLKRKFNGKYLHDALSNLDVSVVKVWMKYQYEAFAHVDASTMKV